jgi:hypothetical protein
MHSLAATALRGGRAGTEVGATATAPASQQMRTPTRQGTGFPTDPRAQ